LCFSFFILTHTLYQSGKIAGELDFVHHNIRTKLDELKRIELERLRKLIRQENELNERGTYTGGRKWHSVGGTDGAHISKYGENRI
jgi:hypothetical protein